MNTVVLPYEEIAAPTFPEPSRPANAGLSIGLPYPEAKPHLSKMPLRRPSRGRQLERATIDRIDAEIARAALSEPGSISLADLERELGA